MILFYCLKHLSPSFVCSASTTASHALLATRCHHANKISSHLCSLSPRQAHASTIFPLKPAPLPERSLYACLSTLNHQATAFHHCSTSPRSPHLLLPCLLSQLQASPCQSPPTGPSHCSHQPKPSSFLVEPFSHFSCFVSLHICIYILVYMSLCILKYVYIYTSIICVLLYNM